MRKEHLAFCCPSATGKELSSTVKRAGTFTDRPGVK